MLVLVFKICPDANMASYLIFMYVTVINVILEIYITNNIKKSSNKFLVDFFDQMFFGSKFLIFREKKLEIFSK